VVALVSVFPSVVYAGAQASAFRPERRLGANYYNAAAAIDGKLETAWMVGGESENVGEWIMLDLPRCTVDKIGMVVGWARDDESFQDYARIKQVKIELFEYDDMQQLQPTPGSTTADFADNSEFQIIDIEDLVVGSTNGGKIKIIVSEIYAGRDYPAFGVSELLVILDEFEVATTVVDVSDESGDHSRIDMVDDSSRTFWAGDVQGASVTFEASGYTLSKVGVQAGPAGYARPKSVEIIANGRTHMRELANTAQMQWLDIPAVSGYTGSAWGQVEMKIIEVYPGSSQSKVAIGELDLRATAYDGF